MTDGYNSFRQAMGTGVDYTFNWFYVDAKDIGYQHSCRCPQRAQGVDPYMPVWGTGQWDWQGFIPFSAQPFAQNPSEVFITSWNNKQAPEFKSNDRQVAYGDPQAPAIMDAWWPRLAQAMFDSASGAAIDNLDLELDDGNRRGHVGWAFDDAFYSHVRKDLVRVLALPQADPWSRAYCGNGVLAACRTALWGAMSQAAADLATEFGSPNVANWKRAIADEDVQHSAVGVTSVPPIHWINRPTFQQVVQLPTADHYKCYKVSAVTPPFQPRPVSLADQFETKNTFVRRPYAICNPVDKNGGGVKD